MADGYENMDDEKNTKYNGLNGFREIKTQFSYSTMILNNQLVTSLEYSKLTKSDNNINCHHCNETQDNDLSKIFQVICDQQNFPENLRKKSISVDELNSSTFNHNFNFDSSREGINAMSKKYIITDLVNNMETMNNQEKVTKLDHVSDIIQEAWHIPNNGCNGHSLSKYMLSSGGLKMLIENFAENDPKLQFSSARLLKKCLINDNIRFIVHNALREVVALAVTYANRTDSKYSRVGTGIIEHLFKHSERTCEEVIQLGGLDAVLFACRSNDRKTLRNCARSLANLSLYGGADIQEAMIEKKVHVWLFPLAFNNDNIIKYYAFLAIVVLAANKEIETEVLKSGTLDLVEPFVTSQDPLKFAMSNVATVNGQHKEWLKRLVPVLSSNREEAMHLAAFHFCMQAVIKKKQGNIGVYRQIGVIEPLKTVASCPNAIASKLAAQTLRLIGEAVPHKLSQQVPLWSIEDVQEWVNQIGFGEFECQFAESLVDGDILLQLNEANLKEDIGITNGILRMRFCRELHNLKRMADYSSKNCWYIHEFLNKIGPDYCVYTYQMLNAGIDMSHLELLSDEMLLYDCNIKNNIHRKIILDAASYSKNSSLSECFRNNERSLDVFISYRRSNGSQLASLLKVHLELRNFRVFIDIDQLDAGKFERNIFLTINQTKNFLLVLSSNALDRCINDFDGKDWLHREIVAALNSNCNIIPIVDNFQWPDTECLPEDIQGLHRFNAITWIHDYQDACIDKIERFMRGDSTSFEKSNSTFLDYDASKLEGKRKKLTSEDYDYAPPGSALTFPSYKSDHKLNRLRSFKLSMTNIGPSCLSTETIPRNSSLDEFSIEVQPNLSDMHNEFSSEENVTDFEYHDHKSQSLIQLNDKPEFKFESF